MPTGTPNPARFGARPPAGYKADPAGAGPRGHGGPGAERSGCIRDNPPGRSLRGGSPPPCPSAAGELPHRSDHDGCLAGFGQGDPPVLQHPEGFHQRARDVPERLRLGTKHPHLGRPGITLRERIRPDHLLPQSPQIPQGQISLDADLRKVSRAQALPNGLPDPGDFQRIQAVEPGSDQIHREQVGSHHQDRERKGLACQLPPRWSTWVASRMIRCGGCSCRVWRITSGNRG